MKYAKGIEDRLIEAAEQRIIRITQEQTANEPQWDGVCGLVKISEEGIFAGPVELDSSSSSSAAASGTRPSKRPSAVEGSQSSILKAHVATSSGTPQIVEQLLHELSRLRSLLLRNDENGQVGKQLAELADVAFRAAQAAIAGKEIEKAKNLLLIARKACPAERKKALSKIDASLSTLQNKDA